MLHTGVVSRGILRVLSGQNQTRSLAEAIRIVQRAMSCSNSLLAPYHVKVREEGHPTNHPRRGRETTKVCHGIQRDSDRRRRAIWSSTILCFLSASEIWKSDCFAQVANTAQSGIALCDSRLPRYLVKLNRPIDLVISDRSTF